MRECYSDPYKQSTKTVLKQTSFSFLLIVTMLMDLKHVANLESEAVSVSVEEVMKVDQMMWSSDDP